MNKTNKVMKAELNSIISLLRHFALFEDIGQAQIEQLAARAEVRKIGKLQSIYQAGSCSDQVYFLTKGSVKISIQSEDGREVIKHVLHPLAMFGELCLAGESRRKDDAATLNEDVQLISIRVSDFQQVMRHSHQLSMRVLHFIGSRLRQAESRLESMIFKDARERIIEFLKESAHNCGKRVGYELLIRHSLTQQDIANITGTSRQTVTAVLNELKKSNLIHFNRRSILIRDLAKLG